MADEDAGVTPDTSRVESQEKILGHREPYNGMGVLVLVSSMQSMKRS